MLRSGRIATFSGQKGSRSFSIAECIPKREGLAATPDFQLSCRRRVDSIIVTHAHQDHVGTLPFLTRREPKLPCFMTEPTTRIADVMLHNSVNVMLRQKEEHGIANYPLFTHRGVEFSRQSWQPCVVRRRYGLGGERGGSNGLTLRVFSFGPYPGRRRSDYPRRRQDRLLHRRCELREPDPYRGADFPEQSVDVLLMETTRGDSPTPLGYTPCKRGGAPNTGHSRSFRARGQCHYSCFCARKNAGAACDALADAIARHARARPDLHWRAQHQAQRPL